MIEDKRGRRDIVKALRDIGSSLGAIAIILFLMMCQRCGQ